MAVVVGALDEVAQELVDLRIGFQQVVVVQHDDEVFGDVVVDVVGQGGDQEVLVDLVGRGAFQHAQRSFAEIREFLPGGMDEVGQEALEILVKRVQRIPAYRPIELGSEVY